MYMDDLCRPATQESSPLRGRAQEPAKWEGPLRGRESPLRGKRGIGGGPLRGHCLTLVTSHSGQE